MRALSRLLLIPFLLILFIKTNGQPVTFNLKNYSADHGLSQGTVYTILQDARGFIWCGTADGLNRFDGYGFSSYTQSMKGKRSLPEEAIFSIIENKTGALFLGTRNKLIRFEPVTNRFQTLYQSKPREKNEFQHRVIPLFEDKVGKLWFFDNSAEKGIGYIGRRGEAVWVYSLDTLYAKHVFTDPEENSENPFRFFNDLPPLLVVNDEIQMRPYFRKELTEALRKNNQKEISTAWFDKKSKLWVSASNCLFRSDTSSGEVQMFKEVISSKGEIFPAKLSSIQFDNETGLVWIGTDAHGVFSFQPVDIEDAQTRISAATHIPYRYFNSRIPSLFIDHSKNLWIGSDPRGLFVFDTKPSKFNQLELRSGAEKIGVIRSIYKTERYTYVGYYLNGIERVNNKTGELINLKPSPELADNSVYLIKADLQGRIWIISRTGIYIFDESREEFIPIKYANENALQSIQKLIGITSSLVQLSPSTFFLGVQAGLFQLDEVSPGTFKVQSYPEISGINVHSLFTDGSGKLFIGTDGTLFQMEKRKDNTLFKKSFHLEHGTIKSIWKAAGSSIVWCATTVGLVRFHLENNSLRLYSTEHGLPNNFLYSILPDKKGKLWISTNKGITCFDPSTDVFRNYSNEDGLQGNEFNTGAYYKSEIGDFFFGGIDGVNFFDPGSIGENSNPGSPVITVMNVFDEPFQSDSDFFAIEQITIPYYQNTLSFEFANLEFTNPVKNHYAYRLKGIEDNRVYSNTRRFVRYSDLEPGEYVFELKASNSDGKWGRAREVRIQVTPPFWKTWWFNALMIVFALSIIYLIVKVYLASKLKKQQMEFLMIQKIQNERNRISRDLHDNVGSQLTYIISQLDYSSAVLKNENEKVKSKLERLSKDARELMNTLRETIWVIQKDCLPVNEFESRVKELIAKYQDTAAHIVLKVERSQQELMLNPLQSINLFRILQEGINNALKHSGASKITVLIKVQGVDHILVAIEDNGIGISKINDNGVPRYGLENLKQRAEEMNGVLEIESGDGTRISVLIPIEKR